MKQLEQDVTNKMSRNNIIEDIDDINPNNTYRHSKIKHSKESNKQREDSLKKEKKLK